ncbi:hypothetical protein QJS10_CPB13g01261 [Acorus calamus]|uniref:Uncharacterized protein n=1 Tax=Acorus calamus TaxID=4465 RepID=A0AAV9DH20_ACOCL|nr:hypothetical protein QJS10_CPB13g01261 [Acorus calamus]
MEEQRRSQSQSTIEGDPASFDEMEITQQVLGHRSGYLRRLGWGPCPVTFGQCSGANKVSPAASDELEKLRDQLETQRDQLETQRVQLQTQQEYISTMQPVMSALLQRFPELGVVNNLSP